MLQDQNIPSTGSSSVGERDTGSSFPIRFLVVRLDLSSRPTIITLARSFVCLQWLWLFPQIFMRLDFDMSCDFLDQLESLGHDEVRERVLNGYWSASEQRIAERWLADYYKSQLAELNTLRRHQSGHDQRSWFRFFSSDVLRRLRALLLHRLTRP